MLHEEEGSLLNFIHMCCLSLSFPMSLFLSVCLSQSLCLCFCLCLFLSLSLTHTHTHTHSTARLIHSHTSLLPPPGTSLGPAHPQLTL